MDKKDRLRKIMKVYDRVRIWIGDNQGKVSPSDINIAQTILRQLEELTVWVDKQDQTFTRIQMKELNDHWKKYA
jgi:hypothetical protein|tara:strand:- start:90 stop:311 length:222 start_codon:yes stop_codon:yes gene_type:complete